MSGSWQLSERYLSPWGEIAYQRFGSGPPLVLVHGTPWSSFCWRHLIPSSQASTRSWFTTCSATGSRPRERGLDVSLGVQNQVLGALLDHLAFRQPRIIGHDFGGTTVLRSRLLDGRRFAR